MLLKIFLTDICLKKDPFPYFRSPELSWDAMLKMNKTKLELISDIAMYLFVENGIKGGIFYITEIYSKGNNKYIKFYDDT